MTRRCGHLPALWDAHRVTAVTGVALLAPLALTIFERGAAMMMALGLAVGLAVMWQLVFARLRGRPMGWDGIATALIFVLLLPGAVPLWHQGLALSFGIVMGDQIFGGRGRGFVNPAVVGLAFLLFSFPGVTTGTPGPSVAIAAALGGALLLAVGLMSRRVIAGFGLGIATLMVLLPDPEGWAALQSASLVLGLVFLIGDPVAAACTNAGRWFYGGLAGALVVLLGHSGDGVGALASVVFAALLASIFAPLIDQIVIWANIRRRARRQSHG
ncbi:MAG TPA: RnfABCDGE type electron transport complex subunit D [Thermohalobaculum sp.]|nr:RnfABCDGE type electron transport complex subunit D [Thermohalobaculum sp.]